MDVSSTTIRVQQGCSVRYLLPDNVLHYIQEKGLYLMKSEHYTANGNFDAKGPNADESKRFEHVLGVEKRPLPLRKNMVLHRSASIAALTHDYAKERSDEEFQLVIRRDGFDLIS